MRVVNKEINLLKKARVPSICFRDCIVEHLLRYVPRASNVVIRKKRCLKNVVPLFIY